MGRKTKDRISGETMTNKRLRLTRNLHTVKAKNYVYQGDKLTGKQYKGMHCMAILRPDGKCIRGKNGNMLVSFNGTKVVVLARQLRKFQTA